MTDDARGGTFRNGVAAIAAGLLAAAVLKELRTDPAQRTWHGRVGFVPYDLRPPTLARVRAAWWNADDPRLLTPRAFGVGWAVNLARLIPRRTGS